MQLGMIGLGRMGANMVRRLMRDGHECVVFDVSADAVKALAGEGAVGATSMADFVGKLSETARGLDDGARGRGRRDAGAARPSAAGRRHRRRRRQLLLPGRHRARQAAGAQGHRLRRRRHQRRSLGARARFLPDDRRTGPGGPASRCRLRLACAQGRVGTAHARARQGRRHGRARLSALRAALAPGTSSRWSTTGSSTGSWPPMPRA